MNESVKKEENKRKDEPKPQGTTIPMMKGSRYTQDPRNGT